jgi:hypothetical protein
MDASSDAFFITTRDVTMAIIAPFGDAAVPAVDMLPVMEQFDSG